MHPDEVRIDVDALRRLLQRQAPQWADLPIDALPEELEGTDHSLFRLGDSLLARMPKIGWAADQGTRDARWLPHLAEHVSVALPAPMFVGTPGAHYPYAWSVTQWLPGANPVDAHRTDQRLAEELAAFVTELHAVPCDDDPVKTEGRGTSFAPLTEPVLANIERLRSWDDGVDLDAVQRIWRRILSAPETSKRVWIHGDLMPGNLLVDDGRLSAVIDWGALGVGDPAPDLSAAWWTFDGAARTRYRECLPYDEATWLRAAGWVLVPALSGLEYYRESAPHFAARSIEHLQALVSDLDDE